MAGPRRDPRAWGETCGGNPWVETLVQAYITTFQLLKETRVFVGFSITYHTTISTYIYMHIYVYIPVLKGIDHCWKYVFHVVQEKLRQMEENERAETIVNSGLSMSKSRSPHPDSNICKSKNPVTVWLL